MVEKLLTSIEVRLLRGLPGSVAFKGLKGQSPRKQPDALAAGAWLMQLQHIGSIYRIHVQAHIVPALGTVELQRLSPAQLNAFYRYLLSEVGKDGQGLAPKTVRNVHNIRIGRSRMRALGLSGPQRRRGG